MVCVSATYLVGMPWSVESTCAQTRIERRSVSTGASLVPRFQSSSASAGKPRASWSSTLTYLMSADARGIATLRRLVADGAQCTGMSGYVTLLLGWESR
jgi:hypothetical protein